MSTVVKLPQNRSDLLDRLDEIATCMEAVADLMIPGADLHQVSRDDLATLLGFLQRQYRDTLERLYAA